MNPDDVADQLRALGLRASSREALVSLISHATKNHSSPAQVCEALIALERRERDVRNLHSRTTAAGLGTFKALDRFDWNHPREMPRELYEQLLTLDFVQPAENILLRGPSGVGKTTLAQNIGLAALQHGLTVRFVTLAAAIAALRQTIGRPLLQCHQPSARTPFYNCDYKFAVQAVEHRLSGCRLRRRAGRPFHPTLPRP